MRTSLTLPLSAALPWAALLIGCRASTPAPPTGQPPPAITAPMPGPSPVPIEWADSADKITLAGKVVTTYYTDYSRRLVQADLQKLAQQVAGADAGAYDPANVIALDDHTLAVRGREDPSASFELDTRSGSFLYNAGLGKYKEDAATTDLVPEQDAVAVALRALETQGLAIPPEERGQDHVGGLSMARRLEDGTTDTYPKLVTVRFDRALDGLPVQGHSRVIVQLGTAGAVAGVVYQWAAVRDERKLAAGDLRAEEEIVAAIDAELRAVAENAQRIVVERAEVILYDDGQGTIEPAYYLVARLYYGGGTGADQNQDAAYDVPYDFWVPIVKRSEARYPSLEKPQQVPEDGRETDGQPTDDD